MKMYSEFCKLVLSSGNESLKFMAVGWMIRVWFLTGAGIFLCHHVQTGFVSHLAF